jgi:plastocyanin
MTRYRIETRRLLAAATTKEEIRPVRSTMALGLTLMLALALAACSSGGASPTPSATAAPPATGAAVTIVDFAFQPADLTVKVGDTVTWTNTGNAPHTVKWGDGTPASDRLTKGGVPYGRTFDAPGTFTYVCGIHGTMKGSITVTE